MVNDITDYWTTQVNRALEGYDEYLLRHVATQLFRPRNQWPAEELIERTLGTLSNPPVLDRRLKDLPPACRLVLALIGHSRQPCWAVGNLVEMLMTLGQADGLEPILTLLGCGLLYPHHFPVESNGKVLARDRLKNFTSWIGLGTPTVFAHPAVVARVLGEPLGLENCPGAIALEVSTKAIHEADGLEWPLRLAVLWQQVVPAPLRRTQQGDFFKRDLDRLRGDPLLSAQPHDVLAEIPDPGLLTVALALALGILEEKEVELLGGSFPDSWQENLPVALASIFSRLLLMRGWNAAQGWRLEESPGNPYPSAYLLALLFLGKLGENEWARPEVLEKWILDRHPFWAKKEKAPEIEEPTRGRPARPKRSDKDSPAGTISGFLHGLTYPLRLLQATKDAGGNWLVRLSPLGRWILGLNSTEPTLPGFPQTLLVQPNLQILAYRQGLTPALIIQLSKFAIWKGLGAACTLQLEPDSVYRALEMGETFASLLQVMERHGMKPTPTAVVESLRTWSNKRDRITVYPAGALFEFASPAELNEALARGLPATRITDRLAIVPSEKDIDYRHFRLTGTRDYNLPPDKCVDVEADGVTLNVDLACSDLLLESELARFAEPDSQTTAPGHKLYRLTPASMAAARNNGLTLPALDSWFRQRTGGLLPAAAQLLLTGPDAGPTTLRRRLVLHLPSEELTDGLEQWPQTHDLVEARLGPTTIAVAEDNVAKLEERLAELGMKVDKK